MDTQFSIRLRKLRLVLENLGLDAFVICDRANTLYMTGFPCSNSFTVVGRKEAFFLTDFRYTERARREIRDFEVLRMQQEGTDELAGVLRGINPAVVGFEGTVSYDLYRKLRKAAGRRKLAENARQILALRAVKDPSEIELIAGNQRVNERVFSSVVKTLRAGMSEIQIRTAIRSGYNSHMGEEAFESIVAAGETSAFPHAVSGHRKVRNGELLLIDMGFKRDLYHSDMTRTLCIGRSAARQKEIFEVVLKAQQAAIAAVRPGARCCDVDAAARGIIRAAGYGDFFGHGLGHGVGLEIHELPRLTPSSCEILAEGMVVTVEPGIYLPGVGGVRIEDLLVVTGTGHRNLTKVRKSWLALD
jgi:Xaa-Pro aminopeptidase